MHLAFFLLFFSPKLIKNQFTFSFSFSFHLAPFFAFIAIPPSLIFRSEYFSSTHRSLLNQRLMAQNRKKKRGIRGLERDPSAKPGLALFFLLMRGYGMVIGTNERGLTVLGEFPSLLLALGIFFHEVGCGGV